MEIKYIVLLLLIIGLFYRGYDLGADSYWIDESYTVLAAQEVTEKGVPVFDSGVAYNRALPQTYALAGIGSIFGFGHVPMRLPSVIAGVVFLLVFFLFVKDLYGRNPAIIATLFATFAHYQIAWSRQARMYIFFELFFFLTLWTYWRWLKGKSMWPFLLSFVFAFLFLKAAVILPPVLLAHYLITQRKLTKQTWVLVGILGMGAALFGVEYLLSHTFVNYTVFYKSFFLSSHYPFLFLSVIGVFAWKKSEHILPLLAFFGLVGSAIFFSPALNFRYVFVAQPFFYMFSGVAIVYFMTKMNRYLVVAFFLLLFVGNGFVALPGTYSLEPGTPQPPFAEAYALVGNETLIVTQPAIAELYVRKPDYWVAMSYSGRNVSRLITDEGTEVYANVTALRTVDEVNRSGVFVIDDMGFARISPEKRAIIKNGTLLGAFGETYWNKVYVYKR